MKMTNIQRSAMAILCLFIASTTSFGQSLVKDLKFTDDEAKVQFAGEAAFSYFMEIAGPQAYYYKTSLENVNDLKLTPRDKDGKPFPDGVYRLQITPILHLTEDQRHALSRLKATGDKQALAAFRAANNLPGSVEAFGMNFSIRNGKFINPDGIEGKLNLPTMSSAWQLDHPSLYASVNTKELDFPARAMDLTPANEDDDQVIADDLIVQMSLCVGFDCVNNESFGFSTIRLKENNTRIEFSDTSTGAFPSTDWQITANDSASGGANKFSIEDITAATVPLTIIGGAPSNSLYIDNNGNVGLGTSTPVLDLQINRGDTPAMRLEQNNTVGYTAQTWDVAGNEANFFIRDVTGGSKLPFRIIPNAPTNSLYINNVGNIGLGTAGPTAKLQVESGDVYVKAGKIGVGVVPTVPLDVVGNVKITGNTVATGNYVINGNLTNILTSNATFYGAAFSPILRLDAVNKRVGIGTTNPMHQLELSMDDAVKPNGGSWTGASDRRLKTDIHNFTDGLEAVLQIQPVKYHYNGKLDLPTGQEFIGVIAQDMQRIAPYTVKKLNPGTSDDYLAFDGSAVTFMLVNAVKEQQQLIDAQQKEIAELKNGLSELEGLKAAMAELTQLVKGQSGAAESKEKNKVATEE